MFVKIEPTGICERKGLVQIRFCMYLEPGDYGYDVHHNNPFHNHFIYVEADTPDTEIMDIGQAFLEEAYVKWACDEQLDLKNPPVTSHTSTLGAIDDKVNHLKERILERRI